MLGYWTRRTSRLGRRRGLVLLRDIGVVDADGGSPPGPVKTSSTGRARSSRGGIESLVASIGHRGGGRCGLPDAPRERGRCFVTPPRAELAGGGVRSHLERPSGCAQKYPVAGSARQLPRTPTGRSRSANCSRLLPDPPRPPPPPDVIPAARTCVWPVRRDGGAARVRLDVQHEVRIDGLRAGGVRPRGARASGRRLAGGRLDQVDDPGWSSISPLDCDGIAA